MFHTTRQFSQQLCLASGFMPLLHEKCLVTAGKSPQARSFQKDETQGTLVAWHRNTTTGHCPTWQKPECGGRALTPAHQSCCGSDITATALPGRRVFFCWGKQLPSSLPPTVPSRHKTRSLTRRRFYFSLLKQALPHKASLCGIALWIERWDVEEKSL